MSLVIWDHTVLPASSHKRTHPALTPARQTGSQFNCRSLSSSSAGAERCCASGCKEDEMRGACLHISPGPPEFVATRLPMRIIKRTHSVLSGLQPPVTSPQETRSPHRSTQSSFCGKNTLQKNQVMSYK